MAKNKRFEDYYGCRHEKKMAMEPLDSPDGSVFGRSRCRTCGSRFYRKYKDHRMRRRSKINDEDFPIIGSFEDLNSMEREIL